MGSLPLGGLKTSLNSNRALTVFIAARYVNSSRSLWLSASGIRGSGSPSTTYDSAIADPRSMKRVKLRQSIFTVLSAFPKAS